WQAPFLLYSGRLEEAKNVPLLVEWFLTYKASHPTSDLKLVLTGSGHITFPDRPDIVRLGVVERDVLIDAFAACLALCQLSLNESFSIVMMEAWQQGRPVIVHADCAVTRDHVERSGGGYLCHNATDFCALVDHLLGEPETAAALGERGRAYVQANFGWNSLVDRMMLSLASFLQPRPLVAELAQRGIRRALDFTYARFEARLIELIQHLCNQNAGWQLFEQVQSRLSVLANGNGATMVEAEPALVVSRARRWVNRLRNRSEHASVSSLASEPLPDQNVVAQLLSDLVDLLRHTRHEQRRLERELALLRDRLVAERHDVR
uniref:glycosyltransferase family 4 protein n=1 Tax=Chloroflexus sp. TaxID=1904827 RepID=UPI002ACDEC69